MAHPIPKTVVAILAAPLLLSGCISTALAATGAVVGGAVSATGAVAGGAVDIVTTSEDEQIRKDYKKMKKENKDKED